MKKLDSIIARFVWFFFGAVILFLIVQSWRKTVIMDIYYTEGQEKVFFEKDNMIAHVVFLILILYLVHKINKKKDFLKTISILQVVVVFAGLLYFIQVVHLQPVWDQRYVLETAIEMRLNIYANFEKGYYLDVCPHQGGLVLFYYILFPILAKLGVIGYIYLNLVFSFLLFIFLWKLSCEIYEVRNKYFICIAIYGFVPMLLYVSFLYGVIPGLLFAVVGFYYGIKSYKCKNKIYILISVVSMAIGVQLKLNYVIFAIAMICLWLLFFVEKKNKEFAIAIVLLIFSLIGFNTAVKLSLEAITGIEIGKGIPSNAYILMGLSENDARAEGWYEVYPLLIYREAGYDTEKAKEVCEILLIDRIKEMKNDKFGTIRFFNNKICSQWLEPSFQGLWLYQTNKLNEDMPQWANWIFRGERVNCVTAVLNLFQSIIYLGALLFSIYNYKSSNYLYLLLPIVFIGGFLFHLFWEAKAQYALPYFFLLIPMAVCGLVEFEGKISRYLEKKFKKTA